MSRIGAAPRAAASPSPARAEASRRNGAKSRGPKTAEGKARSAQNALKHGFRAQRCVVLPGESAAEFAALEAALMEELAPDGALQAVLAQRVVAATWRLARAERLEAQLFAENQFAGCSLGLALIRDCNGARSFDTLLRYRGGALAELWRALRTLKALQAEQAARPAQVATATRAPAPTRPATAAPAPALTPRVPAAAPVAQPDEPEGPKNPRDSGPTGPAERSSDEPCAALGWLPPQLRSMPGGSAPSAQPIEPETRGKPGSRPRSLRAEITQESESASLLAGTALVPLARPGGPGPDFS